MKVSVHARVGEGSGVFYWNNIGWNLYDGSYESLL